jgi:2-dehydropantoate 2-reductase
MPMDTSRSRTAAVTPRPTHFGCWSGDFDTTFRMRFVVYGAGAVGGVIGARLHQHGNEVVLIARGEHLRAIARSGLRIQSPWDDLTLHVPAVEHPSEVEFVAGDVVILAVKSHDTGDALAALRAAAPDGIPVACAQNGVENERAALRLFEDVYGVHVMLPAAHLEPGIVQASSAPTTGILDVGRYPSGTDETASRLSAVFNGSTFDSRALADIMRWKYRKLIMNLGNAVEALVPAGAEQDEIADRAEQEGEACLRAAGIGFASHEEDRTRRGDLLQVAPIDGRERGGGSSWQSLARGSGTIEAGYLNGEIVLLGRLHGFPTPVNDTLQRLASSWAAERRPPGTMAPAKFERALETR